MPGGSDRALPTEDIGAAQVVTPSMTTATASAQVTINGTAPTSKTEEHMTSAQWALLHGRFVKPPSTGKSVVVAGAPSPVDDTAESPVKPAGPSGPSMAQVWS